MCRLFGMSGGQRRIRATFWLLEAPDNLALQSRTQPDGAGLGFFDPSRTPVVHRAAVPADEDPEFATEAKEAESTTFVAHVRYASTGAVALANTQPFEQKGRLFAHNGVVEDLPRLEDALGDDRALVHGETDSERVFALVTREIDHAGGDVSAGIASAASWIGRELPLYALNLVLATADGLWALRYPETHDLFVLERGAGGTGGNRHLDATSAAGRIRVRSPDLAAAPAVIVATERMDEHPDWRQLEPGELLHVDGDLRVDSFVAVPEPPARQLRLRDLGERAAASQHPREPRDVSSPRGR